MSSTSTGTVKTLFYLLYARYGNSHIANRDINQFKYKVFAIIYQYAPSWSKRIEIQEKLRGLTEADILKGSEAIYNTALNPSKAPATNARTPLEYINSQNATLYNKSKMDAYTQLWDLLATDVTNELLMKFRDLFIKVPRPVRNATYVTDLDEEEVDVELLPGFNTMTFTDVWDNEEDFLDDYTNCGIPVTIATGNEQDDEDEGE